MVRKPPGPERVVMLAALYPIPAAAGRGKCILDLPFLVPCIQTERRLMVPSHLLETRRPLLLIKEYLVTHRPALFQMVVVACVLFAASLSAQIANITFEQPPTSQEIHPRFLTSTGNGEVWFSDHAVITDRYIGRVGVSGTVTKFPFPCPGCTAGTEAVSFQSMNIGVGVNIWIPVFRAQVAGTVPIESSIARLTPSGTYTLFPLSNPAAFASSGFGHSAITRGPDGNYWFTENNANAIGRITLAGAPSFRCRTLTARPRTLSPDRTELSGSRRRVEAGSAVSPPPA